MPPVTIRFITKRSEGRQRSGEEKGKEHQRQRKDSGRDSRSSGEEKGKEHQRQRKDSGRDREEEADWDRKFQKANPTGE